MKKIKTTLTAVAFLATAGFTTAVSCMPQELKIPNFSLDDPACILNVDGTKYQCTPDGCDIPVSKPRGAKSIHLSFSCLPKTSSTGFENPPKYVKVQFIQAKNTKGEISFTEDIDTPQSARAMEVNFCLYGKSNNFCGFAHLLKSRSDTRLIGSDDIKVFIKQIDLTDAL